MGLRYANIGIAVGSIIIFGGAFIFRHSGEAALQAVAVVGFVAAFVVYHALDERARRRERKRSQ
jgi:predicted MFS family arabinose efflux permease